MTIQSKLANYPHLAQAQQRFLARQQIQQALETLDEELGMNKQRVYQLPTKNVFFENTVLPDLQFRCSLPHWRETLDDLGLFQRLLGLYDPTL